MRRIVSCRRNPEIGNPNAATVVDQHIRRFEVQMEHALRVSGRETGGKLLADRSLSRLLRQDWPRTPEELEERRRA